MMTLDFLKGALIDLVVLGGWVVALQIAMSVVGLAALFWKIGQFQSLRVGRHRELERALAFADDGHFDQAAHVLFASRSLMAAPAQRVVLSPSRPDLTARLESELVAQMSRLESGFRLFDLIAQLAPLLGLFGTVLGMIGAFQAMQSAGSATDPSVLAGGIWVALLTTAVGLAVGMPASVALTWFESRVSRERVMADRLVSALTAPAAQVARNERLRDAA
jgi:biopolymer transport protein ExbB